MLQRQESPHQEAWPRVQGDKTHHSNLAEKRRVPVFDVPSFEESTSFEFEDDAKNWSPSPQKTACTSQITDICVGISKIHLRGTGQILLA